MPSWVLRDGSVWLVLVGAWLPITILLIDAHASSGVVVAVAGLLAAVALVTTLIFGGLLGRDGRWRDLGLASLAGTASLVACYVFAMLAQPDPMNNNDQAAGQE